MCMKYPWKNVQHGLRIWGEKGLLYTIYPFDTFGSMFHLADYLFEKRIYKIKVLDCLLGIIVKYFFKNAFFALSETSLHLKVKYR